MKKILILLCSIFLGASLSAQSFFCTSMAPQVDSWSFFGDQEMYDEFWFLEEHDFFADEFMGTEPFSGPIAGEHCTVCWPLLEGGNPIMYAMCLEDMLELYELGLLPDGQRCFDPDCLFHRLRPLPIASVFFLLPFLFAWAGYGFYRRRKKKVSA